ncbi:MAG: threonine ammonia-lyase IlvA [Alphaproteobacteria bacterium]|nr:threonine ammonia-lyase IlvA [Alphaproteobacteria bacterium]
MPDFVAKAIAARREMRKLFPETPLQKNDHLSQAYGAEIYLKREDLSPVRSYKIRGAFNAMRKRLDAHPDQQNFVCASAGNHAQGVAYVCRHFNVKGVIFMPITTPRQKVNKTRIFGGDNIEIQLIGDYFEDTLAAAQKFCTAQKAVFLAPFDDADVIEGQASVAVELMEQSPEPIDMVILPVGGGGLSSGVTTYLKTLSPETEFRFVEPRGGQSLAAALANGKPTTLDKVDSFVDGAAVARIGNLNYQALKDTDPAHVLAAPEDRICTTMIELLNVEGIVLEPAGAMAVDVLQDLKDQVRGKRVVCITSGGNFDFERLPEVKERALKFAGLKKYFILRFPQRPGALKDFLNILGPDDDITRFEYLKKSARNFGTVLIGIESKDAADFPAICTRMEVAGMTYQDITENEDLSQFLI